MPTYRQNEPSKAIVRQRELEFGKTSASSVEPPAQVTKREGAVLRTRAGPLELGFTLDTSMSMQSLFDAAAKGFNAFVAEQHAAGPGFLSFNCFSTTVREVFAGLELSRVRPIDRAFLAEKNGATALLDGVGCVIGSVAGRWDKLPNPSRGALVAMLTDGMENASRKFSHSDIFQMIHYRRSVHRWEFLFICASEMAERYGLSLGIQKANICRFDASPEGIKLLLGRLSKASNAFRLGDRNFAGYLTDRSI